MKGYVLPTHPEKPCKNWLTAVFACELLNRVFPSLGKKVRTSPDTRGCLLFCTNLFTHHLSQGTTFYNLHAGFGLEAMSLERSFTSIFPVLHEVAAMLWLCLAAGGEQIGLHVSKNT